MNELSIQHKQALELHQKILVSAQLAQQNLYEMCSALKQMRDDKLYKELGYSNFEEYCTCETPFSKRQAYKYISVIENISLENVKSTSHLSIEKLSLLASVSQSEQAEIAEKIDLEQTTVKQLKAEIDKIKAEKKDCEEEAISLRTSLSASKTRISTLEQQNSDYKAQIDELESKPIEVAVAEPSDNERRLQETIKSLEAENIRHYDELEAQYREDEKIVREQAEKDKQDAINQLTAEYEEKLAKAQQNSTDTVQDDKQVFKAYFSIAFDSFGRMLEFAKKSADKDFFKEKIDKLISNLQMQNENI